MVPLHFFLNFINGPLNGTSLIINNCEYSYRYTHTASLVPLALIASQADKQDDWAKLVVPLVRIKFRTQQHMVQHRRPNFLQNEAHIYYYTPIYAVVRNSLFSLCVCVWVCLCVRGICFIAVKHKMNIDTFTKCQVKIVNKSATTMR